MLTTKISPPNTRNWLTWSTSVVTRETRAPRRSVFWVSSGRSWTCRKALIRSVARPRSEVRKSLLVMKYDATLVNAMATAQARPVRRTKETSGPSGPLTPWSRVCCTAIGTMTCPNDATTANSRVTPMPSLSSGEMATPRRMVVHRADVLAGVHLGPGDLGGPHGGAHVAGSISCS